MLLLVQLAGVLLHPLADLAPWGRIPLAIFGMLVLAMTVRMVRETPGRNWISVTLAIPATLLLAWHAWMPLPALAALAAVLQAAFYFYAAISLVAYMLADTDVALDEVFAAAATFTLLAWAFAHVYTILQFLQPGSFLAAIAPQEARSWTELVYMSFALLSSTGIGDVIPVTPFARAVASIEMFIGVMYLATVVSRLMGLTLRTSRLD